MVTVPGLGAGITWANVQPTASRSAQTWQRTWARARTPNAFKVLLVLWRHHLAHMQNQDEIRISTSTDAIADGRPILPARLQQYGPGTPQLRHLLYYNDRSSPSNTCSREVNELPAMEADQMLTCLAHLRCMLGFNNHNDALISRLMPGIYRLTQLFPRH